MLNSASGHVSHWPGTALACLPLWRPLSERPLPRVVPEPISSLTMPPSVSSASPPGWSRGISGQVPATPSLPTARCPPSCLTQKHGDLFLLLPLPTASQLLTHSGSWALCYPSMPTTPELGQWKFLTSLPLVSGHSRGGQDSLHMQMCL